MMMLKDKGPKVVRARTKKTDAERLALLKQKETELKARIAKIENKAKAEDRKRDARRKIIIGGAVMAHAKHDKAFGAALKQALQAAVTKEADREVIKDFLA
jgi:hypothetical protein